MRRRGTTQRKHATFNSVSNFTAISSRHLGHWKESVAFFRRNKSRYLRDSRYKNRYIAIRYGKVVDADDDVSTLAARLRTRFPDQFFFVTKVVNADPVITLSSVVAAP